jgi:hypothetical protein
LKLWEKREKKEKKRERKEGNEKVLIFRGKITKIQKIFLTVPIGTATSTQQSIFGLL